MPRVYLWRNPALAGSASLNMLDMRLDWDALWRFLRHAYYLVGWFSKSFQGIEQKENQASFFIPLSAIGLLVIVLGIAVETYAEGKASDFDARLREYESDRIVTAESEAAAATLNAGNAKQSAKEAATSASTALNLADIASNKATAAGETANASAKSAAGAEKDESKLNAALVNVTSRLEAAQKQLELEKQTTAKAREETAKVELVLAQSAQWAANQRQIFVMGGSAETAMRRAKLLADVNKYSGTSALIQSVADPEDREARGLAEDIGMLLGNCGWSVKVVDPSKPLLKHFSLPSGGVYLQTLEQWPFSNSGKYFDLSSETGHAAKALTEYLRVDLSPPPGIFFWSVRYSEDYHGDPAATTGLSVLEEQGFIWPDKTVLILVGRKPDMHVFLNSQPVNK